MDFEWTIPKIVKDERKKLLKSLTSKIHFKTTTYQLNLVAFKDILLWYVIKYF